jgi:hypothetical protein
VDRERGIGRGAVRGALPPLNPAGPDAARAARPAVARDERARRLRSPLLLTLAVLLAFESVGGLAIFFARVAVGALPGEALHVVAGVALTLPYALYQWRHWRRVRPWRGRLDDLLGLLASSALALTQLSGLVLGLRWWQHRGAGPVPYPPPLSAVHNIASMLVLTFIASHVGAVLWRDRRRPAPR